MFCYNKSNTKYSSNPLKLGVKEFIEHGVWHRIIIQYLFKKKKKMQHSSNVTTAEPKHPNLINSNKNTGVCPSFGRYWEGCREWEWGCTSLSVEPLGNSRGLCKRAHLGRTTLKLNCRDRWQHNGQNHQCPNPLNLFTIRSDKMRSPSYDRSPCGHVFLPH